MKPKLVPKIWGGRRLGEQFGKEIGEGSWGEAWEVADLVEGESVVATGQHAGKTLGEVRREFGSALVGSGSPSARFPLLVKILDAAKDLSVQVHPGDQDLHKFDGAQSKDESWLILASEDGAILHGCVPGTDRESWETAVRQRNPVPLLRRVEVVPGDLFRVRPGTVHAILEGTALLEIQQPSDTTFRVYDYERPGLDGKPRELHVEQALEVSVTDEIELRPEPSRFEAAGLQVEVLVDVPAYRIERLYLDGLAEWSVDPSTPQVIFVRKGKARIDDQNLRAFQTVVVPAAHRRVEIEGQGELIIAGLGGKRLVDA